ncbi:MBL fold metallo-hydrolase [Streptomyces sp. NEAU-W12]|uniref:MBL fold metallo-hydrolase n=1 Tax=Streptomyces sp. NEAU-W12 TaxID=2994668 RepID=UPI003A4C5839
MLSSAESAGRVQFIGNATLLVRYGALTLLTDPNFLYRGQHAHLGYGLLTRRLKEPAATVDQLPAGLDAVVLSHLHGDHWDRMARRNLDRALPVLTTPHAARRPRTLQGFRHARGLRDWQHHTLSREGHQVRLTAVPGRHAVGPLRGLPAAGHGEHAGIRPGGRAGAPARVRVGGHAPLRRSRGDPQALPGHGPRGSAPGRHAAAGGFVVTMDGGRGAELSRRLGPRFTLPVHHDDYTVMKSPLSAFLEEMDRRGLGERVVHCDRGRVAALTPDGPTVDVA